MNYFAKINVRLIVYSLMCALSIINAKSISSAIFILPVCAIILLASMKKSGPEFTPVDMFWICCILFFVIEPAGSISEPEEGWLFSAGAAVSFAGLSRIQISQYAMIDTFIIVYMALISAMVFLSNSKKEINQNNYKFYISPYVVLTWTISLFFADVILRGGISSVTSPRYLKSGSVSDFAVLTRNAFIIVVLLSMTIDYKSYSGIFCKIISIILTIILFNPFNSSRFSLVQAWLPITLILFPSSRKFSTMGIILLVGVVVIMPILSATTRRGVEVASDAINNIEADSFYDFLDTTRVLTQVVSLSQDQGHRLGDSILSIVLFFVPRALWPSKPITLGEWVGGYLYDLQLVGTDNLSGPLVGDFYADFGLLGALVGSIAAAFFFRIFLKKSHLVNGVNVYNFIIIGSLPILTRGTVGAVIAPFFFMMIFYFIFVFVFPRTFFRSSTKNPSLILNKPDTSKNPISPLGYEAPRTDGAGSGERAF